MTHLFKLLPLLLFTACGAPAMDPAFQSYAEEFEKTSAQYGHNVEATPVVFASEEDLEGWGPTVEGKCRRIGFVKWIEIRKKKWELAAESFRKVLIFHEQGHCVFGLKHDNNDAIMAPMLLPHAFEVNRPRVLEDFFGLVEAKKPDSSEHHYERSPLSLQR